MHIDSHLESTERGDEVSLAVPGVLVLCHATHHLHTLQHVHDVVDSPPLYICVHTNKSVSVTGKVEQEPLMSNYYNKGPHSFQKQRNLLIIIFNISAVARNMTEG